MKKYKRLTVWIMLSVLCLFTVGCNAAAQAPAVPSQPSAPAAPQPGAPAAPQTSADSHYPVTVTTYNYACEPIEITYDKAPEKIVTLNQQTTEVILELGLGDKLVGTAYMDNTIHPSLAEEYATIPVLSDRYPSKEAVIGSGADFLFGWRSAFEEKALGDVTDWHAIGVNTMIPRNANQTVPPASVENFLQDIRDLGAIFDIEDKTEVLIADFETRLADVASRIGTPDKPVTVLFATPRDTGDFWANGTSSLLGDIVKRAGGINLAEETTLVSAEDVINYDPDVLFVVRSSVNSALYPTDEELLDAVISNPALSDMRAIKENRLVPAELADFNAGGFCRTIPAIETYAKAMYPEMYS